MGRFKKSLIKPEQIIDCLELKKDTTFNELLKALVKKTKISAEKLIADLKRMLLSMQNSIQQVIEVTWNAIRSNVNKTCYVETVNLDSMTIRRLY